MNQEIARKLPATIVRQTPIPRGQIRQVVDLIEPTKTRLLAELGRRQAAGEIERTSGDIRLLTSGPQVGQYALRVVLVPARKQVDPRWAIACRALGFVLLGGAALAAALAWLLTAMTGVALFAFCATVLGAFSIWVWAKYGRRRGRGVVVAVNVEVR